MRDRPLWSVDFLSSLCSTTGFNISCIRIEEHQARISPERHVSRLFSLYFTVAFSLLLLWFIPVLPGFPPLRLTWRPSGSGGGNSRASWTARGTGQGSSRASRRGRRGRARRLWGPCKGRWTQPTRFVGKACRVPWFLLVLHQNHL